MLLLSLNLSAIAQQYELIPDANFRTALQVSTNIDPNVDLTPYFNGDSLDISAPIVQQVVGVNVNGQSISDISGIEFFTNLTTLNCEDNLISTLPPLPTGLINLICGENNLQALPTLPSTLEYLHCFSNDIASLPTLPQSLLSMYCNSNELQTLPTLPLAIRQLTCYNNQIVSLPALPQSLDTLYCDNNELTSLPTLPAAMRWLHCNDNDIISLPQLPSTLTHLRCDRNLLQQLPDLPNSLVSLRCDFNDLTSLPTLPPSLNFLQCDRNELQSLPPIPPSVTWLNCEWNHLTALPTLPPDLYDLKCGNNELVSLPSLPNTLNSIYCESNDLVSLPFLPANLTWLLCNDNQLTHLPTLPQGIGVLDCSNNQLDCLPFLPQSMALVTFEAGNNVQCVPNIPPNLITGISLPVCTFNNINGCDNLTVVTGSVYYDENDNCTKELGETSLSNRIIQSDNGSYAISDSTGTYRLFLANGTHTIEQSPFSNQWSITCPNPSYTLNVTGSSDTISGIDFPNHADVSCHNLTVTLNATPHRPCFSNAYHINYINNGTAVAPNAYIDLTLPEEIVPATSSIPWIDLGNGTLRFNIGDVGMDEWGTFYLIDTIDCNAQVGFTVCAMAEIFPISPCFTPDPSWDGSSVSVEANCVGNSVNEFIISNVGSNDMNTSSNYRIWQDTVLYQTNTGFQLQAGEELSVQIPSDGMTRVLGIQETAYQELGYRVVEIPHLNLDVSRVLLKMTLTHIGSFRVPS